MLSLSSRCDLVVHPHIFCLCVYMSEVISAFIAVSEVSQLLAFLMMFLCCIVVLICSGKSYMLCIYLLEYDIPLLGELCVYILC